MLDEPFSSLDSSLRHRLQQFTVARIRRLNIPAVLFTHNPHEAFTLADHIALMHNGGILQLADPNTLINAPTNAQDARLIGAENVDDSRYIPQQALHFNHRQGSMCRVISHICLPNYSLLNVYHPKYGELQLSLSHMQTVHLNLQPGSEWPL